MAENTPATAARNTTAPAAPADPNVLARVKLSTPIETARGAVSEVVIRPPKLRDLKAAGGSFVQRFGGRDENGGFYVRNEVDMFKLAALLAQVTDLDEITLDGLAASDVAALATALAPALEAA